MTSTTAPAIPPASTPGEPALRAVSQRGRGLDHDVAMQQRRRLGKAGQWQARS